MKKEHYKDYFENIKTSDSFKRELRNHSKKQKKGSFHIPWRYALIPVLALSLVFTYTQLKPQDTINSTNVIGSYSNIEMPDKDFKPLMNSMDQLLDKRMKESEFPIYTINSAHLKAYPSLTNSNGNIKSLPIFYNRNFARSSIDSEETQTKLSKKQMYSTLETMEKAFELVEKETNETLSKEEDDKSEIISLHANYNNGVQISVTSYGEVSFNIDDCVSFGIQDKEQASKYVEKLLYRLSGREYKLVADMPIYSFDFKETKNLSFIPIDTKGPVSKLESIKYMYDKNNLSFFLPATAEYVNMGDYEVIPYEEAKEKVLSQEYDVFFDIATVFKQNDIAWMILEENIAAVSLEYIKADSVEFEIPYYKFTIDVSKEPSLSESFLNKETKDGYLQVIDVYVEAIDYDNFIQSWSIN